MGMTRLFGLAVLLAGSVVLLAGDAPRAADEEKDSGWVQLFNGKDLTGWKMPKRPSDQFESVTAVRKEADGKEAVVAYEGKLKGGKTVKLWRVEKGILIGGGPASHLFSERGDYKDFHFLVEAMINDKGNSGQYFRTKFGPGFPQGYEAQINATHADPIRTGSLYLPKVKEVLVKKAPHKPNEWFTQEVIARGNHIVIKVNGKVTVDWKDPENRYTQGHFALQGHDPGSVMKFRKVAVKELSGKE
jgi:hypothetical protein